MVKQQYLDGLVLDLRLADIPAAQLAEEIQAETSPQTPPIVILRRAQAWPPSWRPTSGGWRGRASYALRSPTNACWRRRCCCCIAPRPIFPKSQREVLSAIRRSDVTLAGKKVLVVDDDVRNIFALDQRSGAA